MIRTETYYTSDTIKIMDYCSGVSNVVVSDSKDELLNELEFNILQQLQVGEFVGIMLIPEGVEDLHGVKDIDNRLIKLKHEGTWYSLTPLDDEG